MQKTITVLLVVVLVGVLGYVFTKNNSDTSLDTNPVSSDFVSVRPAVESLPSQDLSKEERGGLVFMREEEKLARDVYITLYEKWGIQIFSNISQSEQTHTEAVRTLLNKYSIADPVKDDSVGIFTDDVFKKLYSDLVARGNTSPEEALKVGAFIEDLDIADLERFISATDNEDIKLVYSNLSQGSRNHLRSFVSQLTSRGAKYVPEYISEKQFNEIISSPKETGSSGGRGWGGVR